MKYPHTRVPSWFFALLPELSECELKVMLVIFKHTLGWQRDTDFLSYSQLTDETGLTGRASIAKALALLEDRGLIKRATKRIPAQQIQVFPLNPIEPLIVQNMNSTVQNLNSESSYYEPTLVHNMNTQKIPPKKVFKDTTNIEKFTPDQEKSLALMVDGGVDEKIAKRLISLAWSRGRDISYIHRVLGYVAEMPDVKNPAGLIVTLIERNNDRKPTSPARQGLQLDKTVPNYHLYDDGGPELVKHNGPREDCLICKEV